MLLMMLKSMSHQENQTCVFFNQKFAIFTMGVFFSFMPWAAKQILSTATTIWQIQQSIV